MKTRKDQFIKILFFFISVIFLIAGCKDERHDPACYKGKVVQLEQSCYKLIEILESIQNSEIQAGARISFVLESAPVKLKVGDVVYFKIVEYVKYESQLSVMPCLFPQFNASVQFCKF